MNPSLSSPMQAAFLQDEKKFIVDLHTSLANLKIPLEEAIKSGVARLRGLQSRVEQM